MIFEKFACSRSIEGHRLAKRGISQHAEVRKEVLRNDRIACRSINRQPQKCLAECVIGEDGRRRREKKRFRSTGRVAPEHFHPERKTQPCKKKGAHAGFQLAAEVAQKCEKSVALGKGKKFVVPLFVGRKEPVALHHIQKAQQERLFPPAKHCMVLGHLKLGPRTEVLEKSVIPRAAFVIIGKSSFFCQDLQDCRDVANELQVAWILCSVFASTASLIAACRYSTARSNNAPRARATGASMRMSASCTLCFWPSAEEAAANSLMN
jgi:hypothetical protein